MAHSETDLAYAAGVIDSDGCIRVAKKSPASSGSLFFALIRLKQVTPQAVDLLHGMFRGTRHISKPWAAKGRPLHTWEVRNLLAEAALEAVLPFLRIKREQALNALQVRPLIDTSYRRRAVGGPGGLSRPPEITIALEALYQTSRDLNRVGV